MPDKPIIIVQLVHIEGPFKGKIEEYSNAVIRIGRNVDCQICFPKNTTIVSRNHAEIVREGNRFKVVDHSTNGTFVNGKAYKEIFLKSGDVIMIGEGGPKFSFLTEIKTAVIGLSDPPPSSEQKKILSERDFLPSGLSQPSFVSDHSFEEQQHGRGGVSHEPAFFPPSIGEAVPAIVSTPKDPSESMGAKIRAPLVIQFGPTIQSFQELPVIVGKKHDCDFVINHAEIIDRHIQFSFYENNYWAKDLTGQGLITINDIPIQAQTPLQPGSRLSLGPLGPVFQFLKGGRLLEVTNQSVPADSIEPSDVQNSFETATPQSSHGGRGGGIFLVIFLVILIAAITWLFLSPGPDNGTMAGEWWDRIIKTIQQITG